MAGSKLTGTSSIAVSRIWRKVASPLRSTTGSMRSEEHTSELQSLAYLVCRLLLEKKKQTCALRSEEHTSELQSLAYLVCRLLLQKKKIIPHAPPPLNSDGVTVYPLNQTAPA